MSAAAGQRARAVNAAFDAHVNAISEGLLSSEEESGLVAALPRLFELTEIMGVTNRPIGDWSREEMLRFLTLAVRAAVPLRHIHHGDPGLSDRLPW